MQRLLPCAFIVNIPKDAEAGLGAIVANLPVSSHPYLYLTVLLSMG